MKNKKSTILIIALLSAFQILTAQTYEQDNENPEFYYNKGVALLDTNKEEALKYFFISLKLAENIPRIDRTPNARIYNKIGYIYQEQTKYDSALFYFKKELNLYKIKYGPEDTIVANLFAKIGSLFLMECKNLSEFVDFENSDYNYEDSTLLYFNNALNIYKIKEDTVKIIKTQNIITDIENYITKRKENFSRLSKKYGFKYVLIYTQFGKKMKFVKIDKFSFMKYFEIFRNIFIIIIIISIIFGINKKFKFLNKK